MVCSTIRNVDLMWSLFLSEYLYSSGVWQGLLLRNIHQKDMCQDEIEVYVLRSIINTIEKKKNVWPLFGFFDLFSPFKNSLWPSITLHLNDDDSETAPNNTRVIHFCWHDGTIPDWIRLRKLCCGDESADVPLCTILVQVHFAASLTSRIHPKITD